MHRDCFICQTELQTRIRKRQYYRLSSLLILSTRNILVRCVFVPLIYVDKSGFQSFFPRILAISTVYFMTLFYLLLPLTRTSYSLYQHARLYSRPHWPRFNACFLLPENRTHVFIIHRDRDFTSSFFVSLLSYVFRSLCQGPICRPVPTNLQNRRPLLHWSPVQNKAKDAYVGRCLKNKAYV
jgi:hypothetical protein